MATKQSLIAISSSYLCFLKMKQILFCLFEDENKTLLRWYYPPSFAKNLTMLELIEFHYEPDKRRAPLCSGMEFISNNGQHTYVQRQMQLRDSLGSYRQHSLGFVYWCFALYRDSDGIGTLIFETLNREKTQGTETREAEDTTCQQIHLKDINGLRFKLHPTGVFLQYAPTGGGYNL